MAKVTRREGESFETMFRRFKRKVNDDMILADIKKYEYFKTKSEKRREKRKAAEQKRRKYERRQAAYMQKMQQTGYEVDNL